ncbi:pyrroline-5-carboxylate reductase, putative [Eimeria tenella]|uniref:Pyrroline-5-carboxylate reductase, putative n=1 Tax=Eimeria tenella TaxID=5802 RepID=U6KX31_EIMTE|nr:pyrroline-5-carboxylate reductase, putative [Eimeria tenella]CDJ41478.1 pyrroline-5-carboxylate reductase, putative [Eimeria tenella]|eukprot:XP_013232228.1 pyrroline-5-carboxylate reductase, putative [Eimeria tenella]
MAASLVVERTQGGLLFLTVKPAVALEVLQEALRAFGLVHAITEDLFDAYCAISGSSNRHLTPIPAKMEPPSAAIIHPQPSWLLDFCAGIWLRGLPRQLATEAALQSVRGTATLVQMKEIHPALLRDDITSPGGTTIAGVLAMERRAFRAAVADAVEATCERSKEIKASLSECS